MKNKKLNWYVSIIVFGYLVLQLTAWVFNEGLNTKVGYRDVPISCSLDECAKFLSSGGPDYSYYLNLANFFNFSGSYIPISEWFLKAWPPGMGIYYALLSKITLNNSYFLVLHILIMILGWCFLLTYPVLKSVSVKTLLIKGILVVYLVNLSLFKNWLFSGFIIYSETLGLLLFFSFIVIFCKAQTEKLQKYNVISSIIAGVLLAMAAYVRIVFDLAALGFVLCVIGIYLFRLLARKKHRTKELSMRSSIYVCIVFLTLTLPWRAFAYTELDSKSFTFASNSNGAWVNAWTPTKNWDVDGNAYFVSVGINHLCVSYPTECRRLNASESPDPNEFRAKGIRSIISNPLPWVENRLKVFNSSFMDASSSNATYYGWILSAILLIFSMLHLLRIFITRKFDFNNQDHLLRAISFVLVGVTVLPLTITAFEPRYLYTLVIMPWLVLLYSNDIESMVKLLQRRNSPRKTTTN
jgi:hypothetical protein